MKKIITIAAILTALVFLFTIAMVNASDAPAEIEPTESAPTEPLPTQEVPTEEAPTQPPVVNYPEIVSITPDAAGFTIKWTAYPDAAKYRLFVRGASGWIRVGDTEKTTMKHRGLQDQTAYTYTVRALNRDGKYMSAYLVGGWSNTFRAAPVLTSVSASGNAMKITWKPIPDADCYRVYRKEGSSWVGIGFANAEFFIDNNVASGTTYTYTVRAFDADRLTAISAFQSSGMSGTFVSMPVITSAEARNSGVRLTWGKVPGAAQYRVFIKGANGWKRIGDTSDNSFEYRNAPYGVASTYTVRAMNAYDRYISDFLREGITHTRLAAPGNISVANLTRGQKITWGRVASAECYRIYVRSGSSWKKLADTAGTDYTVLNVTNGVSYTYTVRCVSANGKVFTSGFNASGVTTRYYEAPQITDSENTRDGALLRWNRIGGVAKYRVFVRSGATWKKLADTDKTEYTHTSAVQGVTYTYTVRALDGSGRYISAYYTPGYTALYQTAPLMSHVIPSDEGTVLSWNEYAGARRYRVYRRTLDKGWGRIADVDGFTYTDAAAPAGIPCQYTLRCLDDDGNTTSDYYENNLYYCDGVLADGEYNVKGYLVTFEKGRVTKGYLTPQDIIRIAEKEVGYQATNYKHCKYNNWYYGAEVSGMEYEWCVVFVEWVFEQAGARDLLYAKTAGTEFFGQGFYEHGRLLKSGFKVGDLLILHWKPGRSSYVPGFPLLNHVGIIIAVNDDGSYTTIEGNTGDNPNGGVVIKRRYPELISGACRPNYGFYIPADNS